MIKAVLFDYDDTLVKTSQVRFKALKYAAKKFYNLSITDEQIKKLWGLEFNEFIIKLFGNVDDLEQMVKKYHSVIENFPNKTYPHVKKILNKLFKKYEVGIITAATNFLIMHDLIKLNIDHEKFCFIQTADNTKHHKPDPKVFDNCLEILKEKNILKKEIIYIGDKPDDYYAASGAGIKFMAIADRTTPKEVFLKLQTPILEDIRDLPRLINYY